MIGLKQSTLFFFTVSAFIVNGLTGCRKKVAISTTCPGFHWDNTTSGRLEPTKKTPPLAFAAPRYNPMNQDEILLTWYDAVKRTSDLVRYNLVTGSKTFIASGVRFQPDWNKKGWILFNHEDNMIWKIKDNGDSLIRLTNGSTGIEWTAAWNKPGTKFVHVGDSKCYIADENGIKLDTISEPFGMECYSWFSENKLAISFGLANGELQIGYFDLTTRKYIGFSADGCDGIGGIDWFPDGETAIWSGDKGMYKTNMTTGATIKLTRDCENEVFLNPTISPDGKKIIVQRKYSKVLTNDTMYTESYLFIMDADGSNRRKLDIK